MTRDPRIDLYIDKAQPFAKPILSWLRALVHKACPEVTETMKWGMPSFDYKGLFCGMASFKKHCTFGFWKYSIMKDPCNIMETEEAMGVLGRIESKEQLPTEKILIEYINEAKWLNDENIKITKASKSKATQELEVPDYLMKELQRDKKAHTIFEAGSYSFKKEYVEWITEAKTEATREKRMTTAIEWIAQGKGRNWKYQSK
ncbi:MAG: hypothetical protein EXR21_01130 [Flavobacteriaceae bacterium]|nr:hypothetical protein [Flavobacteriaceae bacterium]